MKVLIYKEEKSLAPVGGSSGYCFNIKQELERRHIKDIGFINKDISSSRKANTLRKYLISFIKLIVGNRDNIDLTDYDVVHFHSAKDLYSNRKTLKHFQGKIVFTMHSPTPYHMEVVENIKKHHKVLGALLRKHSFSNIDKYAFSRSDYILFPCKEAEESYYKNWKKYIKIHEKNKNKYVYIPTGIVGASYRAEPKDYRRNVGIKENDFVVSYVGRHNEIKGYDRVIKVSDILNDSNIKYLIGGKEFPLSGPKKDNWIEIGWTNDPYSLINSSNVFVLPNRETYFDIVLLEVLSLGKTCIISNTGGNKVVSGFNCPGIYSFETEEQCADIIAKLKKDKIDYFPRKEIIELFNNNFTIEIFVSKYIDFLKSISKR